MEGVEFTEKKIRFKTLNQLLRAAERAAESRAAARMRRGERL
jgi:hypothetical protein